MEQLFQSAPFPVCLAPMAGFTDAPFRVLCRALGADMAVTEMISAKGLKYGSEKTASLYRTRPEEPGIVVQLFGREPDTVADAEKRIADELGDVLTGFDLNMGCPAPKITGNGEGCALMREPLVASRVIEAAAKAARVPVSVKLRKGWDAEHENAASFSRMCEQSGAAFLTVHGRTRAQQYAGRADWTAIAAVKRAVSIPVIGNGDVLSGADALRMRAETGCDGVMIGRGALGNPFVFAEVKATLRGEAYVPPTETERRRMALCHAEMAVADAGERALIELRKHLAWYVRGVPGSARLRTRLNNCVSLDELREILT